MCVCTLIKANLINMRVKACALKDKINFTVHTFLQIERGCALKGKIYFLKVAQPNFP